MCSVCLEEAEEGREREAYWPVDVAVELEEEVEGSHRSNTSPLTWVLLLALPSVSVVRAELVRLLTLLTETTGPLELRLFLGLETCHVEVPVEGVGLVENNHRPLVPVVVAGPEPALEAPVAPGALPVGLAGPD